MPIRFTPKLLTQSHSFRMAPKSKCPVPMQRGGTFALTNLSLEVGRPYTLNEEPQPQVDFTWGFSNLNPAASSVST